MALERMPRKGERVRFGDGTEAKVVGRYKDDPTSNIIVCRYDQGGETSFIAYFPSDKTWNKYTTIVS